MNVNLYKANRILSRLLVWALFSVGLTTVLSLLQPHPLTLYWLIVWLFFALNAIVLAITCVLYAIWWISLDR